MEEEREEVALHRLEVDKLTAETLTEYQWTPFDGRYLISDFEGGSLLRIEPVRKKKEAGEYECVAENGNGDPVTATATLTVYEGKFCHV